MKYTLGSTLQNTPTPEKECSKNSILLVHLDAGRDHWLTEVKYNTTVGFYG